MTDLRALLKEAREQMSTLTPGLMRNFLVERIDAALAKNAPEPVAYLTVLENGVICGATNLGLTTGGHRVYTAPLPASPGGAIPQGLDFARQRNMAVTDEWLRGWEGARQFAMGNTRPNPCNAPQEIQASPDDARDAARMEFLTESNRVTYIGGGTSGTWKFHIDHDGGEDLRHDIDVCMKAAHRAGGRGVSEILFFSRRLWCRIFGHHAKYGFMAPAYKLEDQGPVVAYCDRCGKRWLAGTL